MLKISGFILLLSFFRENSCLHYGRNAFTFALLNLHVPEDEIPIWVCLAEQGSAFNNFYAHIFSDDTAEFGIFALSSEMWCQDIDGPTRPDYCGIICQDLLRADTAPSMDCAKKVVQWKGFDHFRHYEYCAKNLPDIYPYIIEYRSRKPATSVSLPKNWS